MKFNFREKTILEIFFQFWKSPVDLFFPLLLFCLHTIYIILIVYLILFSLSTWHMFVVFCILSVNIFANMMLFRSCPLALMEESMIETNCFRSISLVFAKEKKNKKRKAKVLSKKLPYTVPESTTQNLVWLYLCCVIKMLSLFVFKG